MSDLFSAGIGASLDRELAELRDRPLPHTALTHIAAVIREQFPANRDLARVLLCASRAANGLVDDYEMPPRLVPGMLSLLAGELDRMEREAQS